MSIGDKKFNNSSSNIKDNYLLFIVGMGTADQLTDILTNFYRNAF